MNEYTGIWKLLYDWQTLITGGTALVAALVAGWPMWRQLKHLNTQSAVLAREAIAKRIADIEIRRNATQSLSRKITSDFSVELYGPSGEGNPEINPNWAFEGERVVSEVAAALNSHQSKLDNTEIECKRSVVLKKASSLAECLQRIHVPYSCDLEGPEMTQDAERAEKELVELILAFQTSADELDAAFTSDLDRLRSHLRELDISIIDHRSR